MERNTFDTLEEPLQITTAICLLLKSIIKWTYIISIVGFVLLAIYIILFLLFNYENPQVFSRYIPIIFIIIVQAFMSSYLLRFSSNLKVALNKNDNAFLYKALEFLKRYYILFGIFIIVIVVLLLFFLIILASTSLIIKI